MTAEHPKEWLAEHFEHVEQQREAQRVGMWIFLMTELMLFGALFIGFYSYLSIYTKAFEETSKHMEVFIGSINTLVLLTSSLTMALSVHFARRGNRNRLLISLISTILLGLVFLGLKGLEYYIDYQHHLSPGLHFRPSEWVSRGVNPRHVQLFLVFYYIMTGTHALHMTVGIGVLTTLTILAWRGRITSAHYAPVEIGGLYWHFVDVIWIYLFPTLYLIGTHEKLIG